jgi:geranylgeranyl pyrophosphate synthase
LIHDDLPAMDNDDIRRGKLSTHKKFSESTAILSGNSLLSLAFEILSNKELNINQGEKSNLINTLSNYCGHSGLAGGQYSDLSFENKKISKKNIINMQKKKTGKLFSFCCESVAIISKRKKNERNFLRDLGLEIGLLFQIADDIIDYKGDSLTAGKPTKRDKVKGKATLISIKGYNETLNFANYLRQSLKNKIKRYGNKAKDLSDSIDFMLIRNF